MALHTRERQRSPGGRLTGTPGATSKRSLLATRTTHGFDPVKASPGLPICAGMMRPHLGMTVRIAADPDVHPRRRVFGPRPHRGDERTLWVACAADRFDEVAMLSHCAGDE